MLRTRHLTAIDRDVAILQSFFPAFLLNSLMILHSMFYSVHWNATLLFDTTFNTPLGTRLAGFSVPLIYPGMLWFTSLIAAFSVQHLRSFTAYFLSLALALHFLLIAYKTLGIGNMLIARILDLSLAEISAPREFILSEIGVWHVPDILILVALLYLAARAWRRYTTSERGAAKITASSTTCTININFLKVAFTSAFMLRWVLIWQD